MNRQRFAARAAATAALLAGAVPESALAQAAPLVPDRPGVTYTVGSTVVNDDNLYRLPDGVGPRSAGLNATTRADSILTPFFDVNDLLLYGRQRLSLMGGVSRQMLRANPSFDATYLNYAGDLQWQLGNELSGDLSGRQQESQTSFADFLSSQSNTQTIRTDHGDADWRPRPDRRLGVSYDRSTGNNTLGARQPYDFHSSLLRFELGVESPLGHEVVVGFSQTRLEYPNRVIVALAPVDNSFRQRQIDIGTRFAFSEKTSVDARFGYARRYFADVPDRDFSGPVGNLGVTWQPTGRISVNLGVAHSLNEVDDYNRLYTVSTTESLSLHYALSAKVQITAGADMSRAIYKGDPHNFFTAIFGPASPRDDLYRDARLGVAWTPRDRWLVRLDETLTQRNSSQPGFEFSDFSSQLTLQYQIGPWP